MKPHEHQYCRATEIPVPKAPLEHDTFIDGLTLNVEEIECFDMCVAEYAKMLSKTACRDSVQLVDVSLPTNVIDLESYRNERNRPHAA